MADLPYLADDGTHVFPVAEVWQVDAPNATPWHGEVRWNPRCGVTFEFEKAVAPSHFPPRDSTPTSRSSGGVGTISQGSHTPQLVAHLGDGSELFLAEVSHRDSCRLTAENGVSTASQRFGGEAAYCEVTLSKNNPLAFRPDTPPVNRFFLIGVDVVRWPIDEPVDCWVGSKYHGGIRRYLPLGDGIDVYTAREATPKEGGAWVVAREGANSPHEYDARYNYARMLLSLLSGRFTPFYWHDRFADTGHVTRTYYGWRRERGGVTVNRSPVPIGSYDPSFWDYDHAVFDRLPRVSQRLQRLLPDYDFDWILGPLWQGYHTAFEDRLALACVSLERLAAAHEAVCKRSDTDASGKTIVSSDQMKVIRKRLDATLRSVGAELDLDEKHLGLLANRLADINRPSNRDKLTRVFDDNGIAVTSLEKNAINSRNFCLHGTTLLKDMNDLEQLGQEGRRFDTIRTLIHRGVLALLGYDGPYFDYSERPPEGNYPVKTLHPRMAPSEGDTASNSERKATNKGA